MDAGGDIPCDRSLEYVSRQSAKSSEVTITRVEKLSVEAEEVKQRIQSKVGRPRGEVGRRRQRAHTARSAQAASALAATKRASAAPGLFPVRSRVVFAPPTHRRSIFSDFQFTDAIKPPKVLA